MHSGFILIFFVQHYCTFTHLEVEPPVLRASVSSSVTFYCSTTGDYMCFSETPVLC